MNRLILSVLFLFGATSIVACGDEEPEVIDIAIVCMEDGEECDDDDCCEGFCAEDGLCGDDEADFEEEEDFEEADFEEEF